MRSAIALAGLVAAGSAAVVPQPAGSPAIAARGAGVSGHGDDVDQVVLNALNGKAIPNPSAQQLRDIEIVADGLQPNGAPPPKLAPSSLTGFQLVNINEIFEAEFFRSLFLNVSNSVPGFELDGPKKDELLDILETVLAQEELHALNAIGVLQKFGAKAFGPCEYQFGVTNLWDSITLASTFTDLVLGTLQDFSQLLATNGDTGPVRTVASIVGQEGEQNGFYRTLLARKPSAQPYLTTSLAPFAFSALVQNFIVPGSCPFDLNEIDLPVFAPLQVLSGDGGKNVSADDQTLQFSVDLASLGDGYKHYYGSSGKDLSITYLSGQLNPIVEPISNVKWSGSQVTFEAQFPGQTNLMFGLSIAALTNSSSFASVGDIPAATLAGPGLIEVIDHINSWDNI